MLIVYILFNTGRSEFLRVFLPVCYALNDSQESVEQSDIYSLFYCTTQILHCMCLCLGICMQVL